VWIAITSTLALLGCDGEGGPITYSPVSSVEILPADLEIVVSPGEPQVIGYMARITRENGDVEELSELGWESSNLSLGTFADDGEFTSTDLTGGVTIIRGTFLGVTGETVLTVDYHQSVVSGTAPANAAELFDADVEEGSADAPSVIYPYDQVRIPRNTPTINFMIDAGEVCTLFHFRFVSSTTEVDVYTTDISYIPEAGVWNAIAANVAGSDTTLQLTGIAYHLDGDTGVADSAPLAAADTVTMRISRLDAEGSIYYWSANNEGIYRIKYGAEEAQPYYGRTNSGYCVSCHVISPDGYWLAVSYDGDNAQMGLLELADPTNDDAATFVHDDEVLGYFKTFSPDSTTMLASYHGVLTAYDTTTGVELYNVELDQMATMPVWSPDGSQVAVVLAEEISFDRDYYFTEGSIALLDVEEEDWVVGNEPTVLIEAEDGVNNFYPAWSPDGNWLAFNRSWRDIGDSGLMSYNSYDDPSATLMVMRSDGSLVYELANANGVSPMNGDEPWTNSWPMWAPLPDADIAWIAFSSKRDYGFVTSLEDNLPQIWITGFDMDAAEDETTDDPSSPPFWLPLQDEESNNHIPIWGPL